jgi:hypothetical protein
LVVQVRVDAARRRRPGDGDHRRSSPAILYAADAQHRLAKRQQRPSLVLYVHGADADNAIAYGWADPAAKRVGINLRSMQGSCTLVEPGPR